jgi:hypothetical protein
MLKSLFDAADTNSPSDLGALGKVRSTTSTWSPPSTQSCVQSDLTKLAIWPEPRPPSAVPPSGSTARGIGTVRFEMSTTYMTEPRSSSARSFTTISVSPQASTSSFSKWGRGSSPTTCGESASPMSSTVTPVQPLT